MNEKRPDPKLTAQHFLVGNIFLSALVLVLVLVQVFKSRQQAIDEALTQVSNMSQVVEEALTASIMSVDVILDQFVYDVERLGSPAKLTEQDLKTYQNRVQKSKSLNMAWADSVGDMKWYTAYSSEETVRRKVNLADRPYFQVLKSNRSNEMIITEPFFGKVRKDWVVILVRRLQARDGKFLGIVWCSIGQEFFSQLREKVNVTGQDVFVTATGTPPRFMYRFPEVPELIGEPFVAPKGTEAVLDKKVHRLGQLVTSPKDGRSRISSFSWIGQFPVFVVVGKDLEVVLGPWKSRVIFSVGMTVFGIAALLALSVYFTISHQNFRQYQAQLANSAKFVALGEMSGAIAHEINNPLMIINGVTSKISRLLAQPTPDTKEIEANISKINKTVERISNIVMGLKKVSRQADSTFEVLALDEILIEAVSLSGERFKAGGVLLTTDLKSKEVHVKVNETQLLQVLINLLNNSYDQVLDYPNKWVSISTHVRKGWVEIAVTDSGNGIPESIAKQMMSPFFTTKSIGKGTGLGLSISKDIIEAHQGRLWYDSACANTRFVIELPVIQTSNLPFADKLM